MNKRNQSKEKPNKLSKAIARRLGLDTPQGSSAFRASFKSSLPTQDDRKDEYAILREELISKLSE